MGAIWTPNCQEVAINLTFTSSHVLRVDVTLEPTLGDCLRQFWDLESLGVLPDEPSVYERFVQWVRFNRIRYEVSLPWKEHHPPLPDTSSFAQNDCPVYSGDCSKIRSSSLHTMLSLVLLRLFPSLHHQSVTEFITCLTTVSYDRTSPLLNSVLFTMLLPDQADHLLMIVSTQDPSLVNWFSTSYSVFASRR